MSMILNMIIVLIIKFVYQLTHPSIQPNHNVYRPIMTLIFSHLFWIFDWLQTNWKTAIDAAGISFFVSLSISCSIRKQNKRFMLLKKPQQKLNLKKHELKRRRRKPICIYISFQMALDSKTIKEEILDKDIYEANAIRAKGEWIDQLNWDLIEKSNNKIFPRWSERQREISIWMPKMWLTTGWRRRRWQPWLWY